MAIQILQEKWQGQVSLVTIGATKEEGGSRSSVIKIGGEKSLPALFKEGEIPHKPKVALEIWDIHPSEWPEALSKAYKDTLDDPFLWAKKCIKEYNAECICLRLQGAHPDFGDKSVEDEVSFIKEFLRKVNLPLIILGSGDDTKDNILLPACSEAAKGERCLIGSVTQDNYKDTVTSVIRNGHSLIAESPIDVNIAKQLNMLISDMGLSLERIVINPTIGALGYGLEYAYSIMERARLAALSSDKTVASPFVCFIGQEAWKAKEAKAKDTNQGVMWETITATALIQAGADLLVMRHPLAAEKVNKYIDKLFDTE
ncbi:MAG: acetyl-CoA decarbonylase/synthase complex subunit delta [Candidatus Omnitrophica bacterium]|nr:acetyl-CoA decarbonylase/synthase complex subunit delta [Candidatus Omnitrophota bacterium]